jgi:small subunit ribosomal protein S3Ae
MAQAKKIKEAKAKKRWHIVVAPPLFSNQVICETLIGEPETAIGRIIPINLMTLTGDIKSQNFNLIFKITNVSGDKADTEIVGFDMALSSIKRMVRRGKDKIDMSFVVVTADQKRLRLKFVLVTSNATYLSVLGQLRNSLKDTATKMVGTINYIDLVESIVRHKIQMEIRKVLNKIFPLKVCELRYMGFEKAKIGQAEKIVAAEEEAPESKKAKGEEAEEESKEKSSEEAETEEFEEKAEEETEAEEEPAEEKSE